MIQLKARQAKSKSRLGRYEEMAAEAERTNKLDFEEIQIPRVHALETSWVEATDPDEGFDDRILIDDLSFSLPRNGIVGVIGPNGVGKTTLFKMIVGQEDIPTVDRSIGDTVRFRMLTRVGVGSTRRRTWWRSSPMALDHPEVRKVEMPSRAYVSAFGFKGPDQRKSARRFLVVSATAFNLALTLKIGGNLLLLDEPTNDLDVETLSSLENALLTSRVVP